MNPKSLIDIQSNLQSKSVTVVDVVNKYLEAIEQSSALNIYVPSARPFFFIFYLVIIFGGAFGICLVINLWGGTGIKKAEKY